MSARFAFHVESQENRRRDLPERIFIGRKETETTKHVLLKFLGFVLFHRERLRIEAELHDDNIRFTPDLVQLDYTLRPALWVECGEVGAAKLDKLAVKVPEAEIWVVKRSPDEAASLLREMARVGREGVVSFPNFGHWKHAVSLVAGRMPVTKHIPYQWYDTPNIHLCTLKDFEILASKVGLTITARAVLADGRPVGLLPSLRATLAVYRFQTR